MTPSATISRMSSALILPSTTKRLVSYFGKIWDVDFNLILPPSELSHQYFDSKVFKQQFPSLNQLFPAVHRFSWDNFEETMILLLRSP